MYSVVLTDGKIINIEATGLELNEEEKVITLIKYERFVARLKMDNIAGLIDSDNVIKDTPKIGYWKDAGMFKSECSECGEPAFGTHKFDEVLTNYCPNCGAKMIEPKESEEKK